MIDLATNRRRQATIVVRARGAIKSTQLNSAQLSAAQTAICAAKWLRKRGGGCALGHANAVHSLGLQSRGWQQHLTSPRASRHTLKGVVPVDAKCRTVSSLSSSGASLPYERLADVKQWRGAPVAMSLEEEKLLSSRYCKAN